MAQIHESLNTYSLNVTMGSTQHITAVAMLHRKSTVTFFGRVFIFFSGKRNIILYEKFTYIALSYVIHSITNFQFPQWNEVLKVNINYIAAEFFYFGLEELKKNPEKSIYYIVKMSIQCFQIFTIFFFKEMIRVEIPEALKEVLKLQAKIQD